MPKLVVWIGTSRSDLRGFPEDARRRAGHEIFRVQAGGVATDWRAMPSVGPGVIEIRIHTALEHRVLYVASLGDTVHVLHAFEKKTQKTRDADLDLARQRLRAARAETARKR